MGRCLRSLRSNGPMVVYLTHGCVHTHTHTCTDKYKYSHTCVAHASTHIRTHIMWAPLPLLTDAQCQLSCLG